MYSNANNDINILILVCIKDKYNCMYTFFVYKCLNSVKIMK